jgi:hypothetical protein
LNQNPLGGLFVAEGSPQVQRAERVSRHRHRQGEREMVAAISPSRRISKPRR